METPSLFPLEPSGRAVDGGRPPASRTSAREERAFDSEVERAAERAGGAEARDARRAELHAAHRAERRAGFGRDETATPRPSAQAAERTAQADGDASADAAPAGGHPLPPNAPAPPAASAAGQASSAAPNRADAASFAVGANAGAQLGPTAASAATGPNGAPAGAAPSVAAAAGGSSPRTATTAVLGDGPRGPRDAATARPAAASPSRPAPPEPPVDDAHEILRQVRLHVTGGAQGVREATLSLVPAHLGRLQVKLSVAAGKVGAIVRAESQETLELLERHLPELREALGREGLDAGDIQLFFGLDSERGDARTAGAGRGRGAHRDATVASAPADARLAHLLQRLSPHEGGVDTYA
jgi:flagellar hook-length control protein FliK